MANNIPSRIKIDNSNKKSGCVFFEQIANAFIKML